LWIAECGLWIADLGFWIADLGLWILGAAWLLSFGFGDVMLFAEDAFFDGGDGFFG
jgi:hypothetical protein